MKDKRPFFIGIGGSGMSSLANILLDQGVEVQGYDKSNSEVIEKLVSRGVKLYRQIEDINLNTIDYVVYSSAVKETHPFFKFFKENHILLIHRSELLHEIFSKTHSVAVAGSHGKTSTSTMLSQILYTAGLDPSIMIGGEVPFLDYKGGKFGKGKWGVYESDESDGTFLNYRSDIKIVTNIDNDHLDHYKSENNLLEAFAEFIHNNNSSYCFLDLDDKGIQEAIKLLIKKHNLHFIMNINHDIPSILSKDDITETILIQKYYIEDHSLYFDRDGYLRKLVLPYTGDHYLKNAFLALLVAEKIGVEVDFSLEVLRNYTGVKRRLEYLGNKNGIKVYDDYGHHPTEIKAVIQSLKQMRKLNEKCCVIFQPHRYTRTRDHYLEFAKSLDEANLVFLLPIYSAEETPIEGISSDLIYQEMENKDSCLLLTGKLEEDISIIEKNLLTGDFLVSLGAGSVRNWAQEFLR